VILSGPTNHPLRWENVGPVGLEPTTRGFPRDLGGRLPTVPVTCGGAHRRLIGAVALARRLPSFRVPKVSALWGG
jgi:hypothetical protein